MREWARVNRTNEMNLRRADQKVRGGLNQPAPEMRLRTHHTREPILPRNHRM